MDEAAVKAHRKDHLAREGLEKLCAERGTPEYKEYLQAERIDIQPKDCEYVIYPRTDSNGSQPWAGGSNEFLFDWYFLLRDSGMGAFQLRVEVERRLADYAIKLEKVLVDHKAWEEKIEAKQSKNVRQVRGYQSGYRSSISSQGVPPLVMLLVEYTPTNRLSGKRLEAQVRRLTPLSAILGSSERNRHNDGMQIILLVEEHDSARAHINRLYPMSGDKSLTEMAVTYIASALQDMEVRVLDYYRWDSAEQQASEVFPQASLSSQQPIDNSRNGTSCSLGQKEIDCEDLDENMEQRNGENGKQPTESRERNIPMSDNIVRPSTSKGVGDTYENNRQKNEENGLQLAENGGNNTYRSNNMVAMDRDAGDAHYELLIDISDAVSEREKVKYTVLTKTTNPAFAKPETSVVREHDEFIWLHNCLEDNEAYAGFIIPPAPQRPDFDASREKLQKLAESEATMTRDRFQKIKHELEQEYLATFKKTVAMHEMFLCRIAAHPIFCKDTNFQIFLEYENDLSVRGRSKKEMANSFFKRFTQSADKVLLSGQKDVDDFFEQEKNQLVEYHARVNDATSKADRACSLRKNVAETYGRISIDLEKVGQLEAASDKEFGKFLAKASETLEKLKKAEARAGTDEELKEADTLRHFLRETQAAKDLLYRRTRCLANYESSNKNLERARARGREIPKAEEEQAKACKKFVDISAVAKTELVDLRKRRVEAFKKSLAELADLEVKQSKNKLSILQSAVAALKEMSSPDDSTLTETAQKS